MKKIAVLLSMSLVMAISITSAQEKFQPYVNVGTSVSSGTLAYSGELGIYQEKAWYALGVTSVDVPGENQWFGSFKTYYKIASHSIVDAFATGAVNVHIAEDKALSLEPGAAIVFNVSKRIAPQFSVSLPIPENTNSVFKPFTTNFGFSLNVWLY